MLSLSTHGSPTKCSPSYFILITSTGGERVSFIHFVVPTQNNDHIRTASSPGCLSEPLQVLPTRTSDRQHIYAALSSDPSEPFVVAATHLTTGPVHESTQLVQRAARVRGIV